MQHYKRMKKIHYIIIVICALCSLSACEENDPKGFVGEDAIYFQLNADNWADTKDSVVYTFAGKSVDKATVNLLVNLMGLPADHDRIIRLHVDAANTTAQEGKHYERLAGEYTLEAGEMQTVVPVVLLKDVSLTERSYRLTLALDATDELRLGVTQRTVASIVMSNILVKPSYWEAFWMDYMFGPYSRKKHEIFIQVLGHDFPATSAEYSAMGDYWQTVMYHMNNYFTENYPIYDENGNIIEPWM